MNDTRRARDQADAPAATLSLGEMNEHSDTPIIRGAPQSPRRPSPTALEQRYAREAQAAKDRAEPAAPPRNMLVMKTVLIRLRAAGSSA